MDTLTRRLFLGGGIACATWPAMAGEPFWYAGAGGYAADGADVVAYRALAADARGVAGDDAFRADWNGAMWRFATADNRAAFLSDPEAFAPRFGGYCAWAVANGYTAHGDRNAWHIHKGRLYLNYSRSVRKRWRRDVPGNIARAEGNWPGVLSA